VFESFSGHLFVRQVNIFILNVYLKFNSWCVLFIWIIYKSSVYKLALYIHFSFKEHSAYSKSVWFSYCAPVAVWRNVICREKSSSHSYNIWFVLERAFDRWYGVFEYCFNVLLWWCQWMKRDKMYIYKLLYNNCLK
jgi:hypothetical protein